MKLINNEEILQISASFTNFEAPEELETRKSFSKTPSEQLLAIHPNRLPSYDKPKISFVNTKSIDEEAKSSQGFTMSILENVSNLNIKMESMDVSAEELDKKDGANRLPNNTFKKLFELNRFNRFDKTQPVHDPNFVP